MSAILLQTVLSSSSLTDKADELQQFVTGFDSEAGPMNLNLISATCEFCRHSSFLYLLTFRYIACVQIQILLSLAICQYAGLAHVRYISSQSTKPL